jgi:predicted anti-sigma-YlaC factor YlaD
MNCKRAKQELALSAGHDLDALTEQDLRRHLEDCPDCSDQWNRVRGTTTMLQRVAVEEIVSSDPPQLWASLSQVLPQSSQRRTASPKKRVSPSNAFVPLVAIASLIFAVFSIHQSLEEPAFQPSMSNGFQLTADGVNVSAQNSNSTVYPESHLQFESASFPLEMNHQSPVDIYCESKSPKVDPAPRRVEDTSPPFFLIR